MLEIFSIGNARSLHPPPLQGLDQQQSEECGALGDRKYTPAVLWDLTLEEMCAVHKRPGAMPGVRVAWDRCHKGYVAVAQQDFAAGALIGPYAGTVRKAQGPWKPGFWVGAVGGKAHYVVTDCLNEGRYIVDSFPEPGNVAIAAMHVLGIPFLGIQAAVDVHAGDILTTDFSVCL